MSVAMQPVSQNQVSLDRESLLAVFERMTTEELKQEFRNGIRMVQESFVRAAFALRVLEDRGEDTEWATEECNPILVAWLRRIACEQMDAQVIVRWHRNAPVVNAIGRLPLPDQKRLVAGESVPLLVIHADGRSDRIMADPGRMEPSQLAQVFAKDHIRDEAEQRLWLEKRRQIELLPPPERIGPFEADLERGIAYFTGKRDEPISEAVIRKLLNALRRKKP